MSGPLHADPEKLSLLEAIRTPLKPFNYLGPLGVGTVNSAGKHVPSVVCRWTSFVDEATAYIQSLTDTSKLFQPYQPCTGTPASDDVCLYLCDQHHFPYINQLTEAAGMPGLELFVRKSSANLPSCECESIIGHRHVTLMLSYLALD